ncbi:MAG: hypothetical protein GXO76_12755 [Calditrichaeota bacterium]|nr:hypothetical protein [Calditrichota bacterium]
MIFRKTVASLVIAAGVILSSLFAAHMPPRWIEFGISIFGLGVGLISLRMIKKRELLSQESASDGARSPDKILRDARVKLEAVSQAVQKNGVTESEIEKLDTIQTAYFLEFASKKETLIERYGIKKYADFMIPFSMAERFLNRSISSGIDGYYEEVTRSLKNVFPYLKETIQKLEER